jgi:hypothetical protein
MNYPNNITAAQNCRYVTDNRLYVQGIAGANSYPVAPGTIVQLMDNEAPYFYLKSADINGVIQPLKRYRYEEDPIVQAEKQESSSEYVTKEDFDKKFDEIMTAIAGINRPHYNNNRKGDRNDTRND